MQLPCLHLCNCKTLSPSPLLGFRHSLRLDHASPNLHFRRISRYEPSHRRANCHSKRHERHSTNSRDRAPKPKGKKENIWSLDNDMAKSTAGRENERSKHGRKKKGGRAVQGERSRGGSIMVSGALLMEVETVLQTQEPVIRPLWNTFESSVSGIWKGVGAVFSPITAEMEPIEIGKKGKEVYDCYTLSRIEAVPSPSKGQPSQIHRKINWATFNPQGNQMLPNYESFDLKSSDVMEEDVMGNEPGLVFFEDGSYSRGPVMIPVGEVDDSNYFMSPTFKFEQCLVKGCHKRLRIVHTIEFSQGGADVQILRVAAYEEQWASPANFDDLSDAEFDLKPFSQRRRLRPSELIGSWKVFEMSATPIFGQEIISDINDNGSSPYVYLCTETLKKRSLPGNSVHFGEEEMLDTQDVTVLWLPGGVTAYVDVNKEGILCIGVGWYSDEGINLVMERDYDLDGNLKEVRSKTELKRRWSD
ncbi:unnamed protein product [Linum trigynum]|uniref:Calycin-like protein n=1 Tax=Linum trigynum TaxID=586398 RepID=A0AAV2ESC0_9ROSI